MTKNVGVLLSSSPASPSSSVVAASLVVVFFFVVVVSSWTDGVQCQELVYGSVSQVLSDNSAVNHLSTGPREDALPSSLKLNVKLGGRHVHLQLTRDTGFKLQLPVYVLSTDSLGALQSRRARLRDTEFAVYQDIEHEGAFGVIREKDANGTTRYKLQGIVHSEGQVYNLRTRDQAAGSEPRVRRHAASADTAGDNNVDDNSAASKGEEEEGDEVFEVKLFPDKAAVDGADFLPAPPPPEKPTKTLRREEPLLVVPIPSAHGPSVSPPPAPAPVPAAVVKRRRRRRQATQQVYVDVVAVVDYGAYFAWFGRATGTTIEEKRRNTLTELRQYYAIVMNGVDLLYKTISSVSYGINVRLVGIVVSSTASSAQWTEQLRRSGTRWDTVDSKNALEAFSSWAADTDVVPAHDHLMLFTGYDLSKTVVGVLNTGITGLAYTGTACRTEGQAVSIVEDLGGFQSIVTAAHELGHGLSAEHDGAGGNSCRSEDRYIMSAGTYEATDANKLNPWRFSYCSVNYFTTFIQNTVISSRGQQCLYSTLSASQDVPDVTSLLPGQMYDPDEQCRQVYGPESRYCRGAEFGLPADICTDMFCFNPSTSSTCIKLVAARGTTCGSQKWCQNGQCVTDAAAPVVDDTCVFGDQPGIAFEGADCPTFVDILPGYCYQQVVRSRCCVSCARHYQLVTGCEYGDKGKGCNSDHCPYYDQAGLQNCCGTCNYGTPFTTTAVSTSAATCVDNPAFTLNQMSCPTLVASQPELCYDVTVRSPCCSSCRGASTGTEDCEYGDRDPSRCTEAKTDPEVCGTLRSVCCKTCAGDDTSSASSVVVVVTRGLSSSLVASIVAVLYVAWTL